MSEVRPMTFYNVERVKAGTVATDSVCVGVPPLIHNDNMYDGGVVDGYVALSKVYQRVRSVLLSLFVRSSTSGRYCSSCRSSSE